MSHLAVLAGDDHVAVRHDVERDAETVFVQLGYGELFAVEDSPVEIEKHSPVEFEFNSQGDALFGLFARLGVLHAVDIADARKIGARAEGFAFAFENDDLHIT